ncbi:hypothetical protein SAY86_005737 [Trapa natans]|uniref:Uncharacterized protein n=1 Tax=Trapa natans TaxID=22666 RepID=A0AAN7QRP8_TRANT|nr:hypothetical protein SAY86_005737 [Trapa natans]
MASSSETSLQTQPDWRHDVFVSFRGEDTRKGFASHLFHALERADIRCYRDIERQERGQVVGPMLIKAIRDSRIAIIILSTNYADSKWCLEEVVKILECNKLYKEHGHEVIPIFYDVEPSEVRRQTGKFGEGFKRCQTRDNEERELWRAKLEQVGSISSWHLDNDARDEAELIELIVQDLSNRVFYFRSPYYTNNTVGIDQEVESLISLLHIESVDVRVIGVYGMEGIGKTVIAKAICNRLYRKFQGVSFLEGIQHADDEQKLVKLQKQLLQDVLKIRQVMFLSDRRNGNISMIRKRLYDKKMLLVLDGLDKKEQVYSVTGEHDFLGAGSRILITTRNRQLLDDLGITDEKKYMVSGLNAQDSLQLFCHHAFAEGNPRAGYEELSSNLAHYVGGIPLAIETFASFLSGKMKEEWHQILEKLVKSPHLDSFGVYLASVSPLYPFKRADQYGGYGDAYDDNARSFVRKITVVVKDVIQTIIVEYDHDGSLVRSGYHGGIYERNGTRYMFVLDYPEEFLISVSGYIEEGYSFGVIRSLRFQSNRRLYGPFGDEKGTFFAFPAVDDGRILGFFGNCDNGFVNSIGAYFGPIPHPQSHMLTALGPLDGEGEPWDDKKHMDIRQIDVVVSASMVESISVLYDNYGHPLGPFIHGNATAGGQNYTVKLDYPFEYLTSISGYMGIVSGKLRVCSLTFRSNWGKEYGPFGPKVGMHFPYQWLGGKIVGFFGTVEDSHLESIKAHLEPVSHIHPLKDAGPFGSERGNCWDDGRSCGNIREIVITWDGFIRSIKCVYEKDGLIREGIKHDGSDGSNETVIKLNRPDEYISMMSGYYGQVNGATLVINLTFISNIRTYGPFGGGNNLTHTYFRTPWNIGMINGFYGRGGNSVNAIGAHFVPIYHRLPLKMIGPFGDDSRDQWDDGKHNGIRQINISYGQIIDSISCTYDDNGDAAEGSKHGGGGPVAEDFKLDYPNEYVSSISGHIGQLANNMCIRSLTFKTNKKRTFGPFGSETGTPFFIESNTCKIVGLFGSSSIYLHSIGAHMEVLLDNQQQMD